MSDEGLVDAALQPRRHRRTLLAVPDYSRDEVAALVDHTLLKPESTEADVARLAHEAAELGVYAICVSPSMVRVARQLALVRSGRRHRGGFPFRQASFGDQGGGGASRSRAGAEEIDMVIDVGAAVAGDFDAVQTDVAAVRGAIGGTVVLKVIVESAALLSIAGERVLIEVCRAADVAGADFVKTSTGFHPSGGASVHAVELMAAAVGPRVEVKASGGIRTAADATAMLDAGATRLGLSGTRAVLDGLRTQLTCLRYLLLTRMVLCDDMRLKRLLAGDDTDRITS